MIGWTTGSTTNCTQLLSAKTTQQFNLNLTSDYSVCVAFSTNFQLYGNVECLSTGTAHANFTTASNCNYAQSPQPAFPLVTKPATWGESQCWGGSQVPNGFNAIMITCVQGDIPPPVAPTAPVAPVPVPQTPISPTPTGPAPVPTGTPSPVSVPVAPTPTSTPSPVSTPSSDPYAYAIVEIIRSTATDCSASGESFNATDETPNCLFFSEGLYLQASCTTDDVGGWAYGFVCPDSQCASPDCGPWAGNNDNPSHTTWGEPRCVNTTAAGFSAVCYPVYDSQVPVPVPITPVPHTPVPQAPISPPPFNPTPTNSPSASSVTIDWSAEFGETCGAPMLFGSFPNSTSCQAIYADSVYATATCNAAGTPSGKICTSCANNAVCTSFAATASVTWGKSYCVTTPQKLAISLSCNNHTTPPAPVAPVAPSPPSPPPVSSGGKLTFSAFMDPSCTKPIQTIPLVANISLCQQVTAVGTTIWMKADCYANGTVHGGMCTKDSTCQECTPLPPAPSGLCVPYSGFTLVSAIQITCPIIVPPTQAASTIAHPIMLIALCFAAAMMAILL